MTIRTLVNNRYQYNYVVDHGCCTITFHSRLADDAKTWVPTPCRISVLTYKVSNTQKLYMDQISLPDILQPAYAYWNYELAVILKEMKHVY